MPGTKSGRVVGGNLDHGMVRLPVDRGAGAVGMAPIGARHPPPGSIPDEAATAFLGIGAVTGGGDEVRELAVGDFQTHEREGPDGRRFGCLVGVALVIAHDERPTGDRRHGTVERRSQRAPRVQGSQHGEDTDCQK